MRRLYSTFAAGRFGISSLIMGIVGCVFLVRIEHRLERLELFRPVSNASVELRGWDFPHIDTNEQPHIDAEWAGQIVDWEHSLELWRICRIGQFLSISGIFSEWRGSSTFWPAQQGWTANTSLGINETIARVTEVFEFAARLSQTKAGDDSMVLAVTFANMANRLLVTDSPNRLPLSRWIPLCRRID